MGGFALRRAEEIVSQRRRQQAQSWRASLGASADDTEPTTDGQRTQDGVVSLERMNALIDEAYRIGMRQVEAELQNFLDLLSVDSPRHFMVIGSERGGLFFLISHLCKWDGLRIAIDEGSSDVRSQMIESLPGAAHELVGDSQSSEIGDRVATLLGDQELDLLFIDGDRTLAGVRADYETYRRFVRPGGLIAFHDVVDSAYNRHRGIAVPEFWRQVKTESSLEFRAGPGRCGESRGEWASSASYARDHEIPAEWGGIGVLTLEGEPEEVSRAPAVEEASVVEERRFLAYCPTNRGDHLPELLAQSRTFDVALNDYSGEGVGTDGADWAFAHPGHKWPGIVENLPRIDREYEAYLFLDSDVTISAGQIDTLFRVGLALGLDLFQAALTSDSITAYHDLIARPRSLARPTRQVEIMMPAFSREGLRRLEETFVESESGWGLDYAWASLLDYRRMGVIDSVIAGHRRPTQSESWQTASGLSPVDEMNHLCARYGVVIGEVLRS